MQFYARCDCLVYCPCPFSIVRCTLKSFPVVPLTTAMPRPLQAHTLKALADVKAGRLLDHDVVKAWAAGLTMATQSTQKRRSRH